MGIGWARRAGGNKFEFAKDLMERDSVEKFWKDDVLSATEGNTERTAGDRAGYVIGDREVRSIDLGMTGCRQEKRISRKGNESGASLSWLALNAPAHKHRICIALVLSRLLLPCPLSFLPLGTLVLLDATPST